MYSHEPDGQMHEDPLVAHAHKLAQDLVDACLISFVLLAWTLPAIFMGKSFIDGAGGLAAWLIVTVALGAYLALLLRRSLRLFRREKASAFVQELDTLSRQMSMLVHEPAGSSSGVEGLDWERFEEEFQRYVASRGSGTAPSLEDREGKA